MNLETKLNNSLDNILRSSGYVFEIINRNKKNSNLIIGPNNQLINSKIVDHLSSSLKNFDDILDETIGKFNDAKWCIEQIVENKLRQEEMKLKEESDRKLREEQERVRKEEERKQEARRAEERKKEEEAAEEKRKQEAARKKQEEEDRLVAEKKLQDSQQQQQQQQQDAQGDLAFDGQMMISPTFDFNLDELANDEDSKIDIPNPSDILSSMNYTGKDARGGEKNGTSKDSTTKNGNNNNNNNNKNNNTNNNSNNNQNNTSSGNGNNTNHNNSNGTDGNTGGMNDLDLDMNNLLGSDTLLLDGLNMNLLDQGLAGDTNIGEDEEFDVDSFLNQFGGAD